MRILLLLSVLLASSSYATSQIDVCKARADNAEVIMKLRQLDYDYLTLKQDLIKQGDSITMEMLEDAYDQRSYVSEDMQEKAVKQFRNKVAKECASLRHE